MGIISNKLNSVQPNSECEYIDFTALIKLLSIYTDDDNQVIATYLLTSKEFLELDFYRCRYMLEPYSISYDEYKDDDPVSFPLKDYLEDLVNGNDISDIDTIMPEPWSYSLLVNEILEVEEIKDIALNYQIFQRYWMAMTTDAIDSLNQIRTIEQLQNEVGELKSLNQLTASSKTNSEAEATIRKLENEVIELRKQLDDTSLNGSEEPTHPKSVGTMTALIATLFKMAEYDKEHLEQPYGVINNIIASKAYGLNLNRPEYIGECFT